MIEKRIFDDFTERLADVARSAPARDLEKNLRALVLAFFDRFDVVTREEFEVQERLLQRAQAKLAALESRVAELESVSPPAA